MGKGGYIVCGTTAVTGYEMEFSDGSQCVRRPAPRLAAPTHMLYLTRLPSAAADSVWLSLPRPSLTVRRYHVVQIFYHIYYIPLIPSKGGLEKHPYGDFEKCAAPCLLRRLLRVCSVRRGWPGSHHPCVVD